MQELIPYRKKDKWGFCTPQKEIVIDCIYDEVTLFSRYGTSTVKINGNAEDINKNGEIIVIEEFEDDRYFYYNGKEYVDGKIYDQTKYWDTEFWSKNRYYYFSERLPTGNSNDVLMLPKNYKIENLVPIFMNNDQFGYMNSNGELILDPIYCSADFFYDDVAMVMVATSYSWGFINKFGDFIFPPKEDIGYGHFSEGLAYCINSDGFGFINKEGKIVIPCNFGSPGNFSEGYASVRFKKWGYINKGGLFVIPDIYDSARDFKEGLGMVILNNKCGYYNKDGILAIPCIFDEAESFSDGIAKVKTNNKWGYINKLGDQYWED